MFLIIKIKSISLLFKLNLFNYNNVKKYSKSWIQFNFIYYENYSHTYLFPVPIFEYF
jgi:hypothetical protein